MRLLCRVLCSSPEPLAGPVSAGAASRPQALLEREQRRWLRLHVT